MSGIPKTYLGDSVYAEMDSGMIALTADGTRTIYLEPEVFESLLLFAQVAFNVKITVEQVPHDPE